MTVNDIENLPDLDWLVTGILPSPSFAVIFGELGCGETFVSLSMALDCACGYDFLGRRLKDKIAGLHRQMQDLKAMAKRLDAAPDSQVSITDTDARSMATSGRGSGMVGYNV